MRFEWRYTYEAAYVPPRCRKPRLGEFHCSAPHVVDVPELTLAQAPVAFRWADRGEAEKVRHLFDGKLYTPMVERNANTPDVHLGVEGIEKWFAQPCRPSDAPIRELYPDAEDKGSYGDKISALPSGTNILVSGELRAMAAVQEEEPDFIIIDGMAYWRGSEPCYEINTFGFSGNHGGTGFFIETVSNPDDDKGSDCFRADEREEALACAVETATNRGDTNDAPRFTDADAPRIEVLIPEAVRFRSHLFRLREMGLGPLTTMLMQTRLLEKCAKDLQTMMERHSDLINVAGYRTKDLLKLDGSGLSGLIEKVQESASEWEALKASTATKREG